ncbi:hypothetical protein ACFL0U_01680 [Pseudomonadota bacterium]
MLVELLELSFNAGEAIVKLIFRDKHGGIAADVCIRGPLKGIYYALFAATRFNRVLEKKSSIEPMQGIGDLGFPSSESLLKSPSEAAKEERVGGGGGNR